MNLPNPSKTVSTNPLHTSLLGFGSAIGVLVCLAFLLNPLHGDEPDVGILTEPETLEDPYTRGWDLLSKLLIVQSIAQFEEAMNAHPERAREGHLGLGIAHLNLQPKSRSTIETAGVHFAKVKAEEAHDDFGIRARYFLGRIEQIHRYEPDWEKAGDIYHRLHEEHPDHPIGETARVRWVTIRLYEPSDAETKVERFTEAEAFRGTFVHHRTRRDYHLLMANAYTHFKPHNTEALQQVLEHLMEALEAGIHNQQTLATTIVRVAEIARLLENYSLADEFYGRFLDTFSRDNRVDWVADRRTEIQPYLEETDEPGTDS